MDPQNNAPTPSFDLPRPNPGAVDQAPVPDTPPPEINQQTEQHNMELPAAPAPTPPPTQLDPQVPTTSSTDPVSSLLPAAAQPTTATDDSLAAGDSDLIEKAWVLKAKAIVEQTKDDPYKQNNEINRVKASYIKKRYNKDIKLNEETDK